MFAEHDKLCIAGEFHTDDQSYHINGKDRQWRDGFRIKGSIRIDQLPAGTQYNEQKATLDRIYYRLRGEIVINPNGITFIPAGEEQEIKIRNSQLPPEGLDVIEEDSYHHTVYRGTYKPGSQW